MKKKILIIGFGSIGKRHAKLLKNFKSISKIYILTKQNCGNFRKIKHISEVRNINPDYILICSRTSNHFKHLSYLEKNISNKTILVEKPLFKDVRKLKIKKNKVFVGYNLRYHPIIQFIKKYVNNKKLFSANVICHSYLPNWRKNIDYTESNSAKKTYGGGALLELSHEIDYLRWIFGEPKLLYSYNAKFSQLNIDVEDYAFFLMQFINNQKKRFMCEVALDFFTKQKQRKCIVIGDKGVLEWNGVNNNVTFFNNKTSIKEQIFDGSAITLNDMYLNQTQHFLNCIETRNRSEIDILEGVSTLRILLEAKNKS